MSVPSPLAGLQRMGLLLALAAGLVVPVDTAAEPEGPPGVFILGVDGVDPVILQRLMDEGKTPNLKKLAAEGTFQELGTSNPPQSPVAWTSFITGMNPGGHGIFDFVHRDPATYMPISSSTPPPEEPGPVLHFFGYHLPLTSPQPQNNRTGTPFWDPLVAAGVDVEVYRVPGNFPSPVSEAKVLSGMGTVDLRGGYGTYTLYTSRPTERADVKGDIQLVTVQDHDLDGIPDTASGVLRGPPDLFRMEPGAIPQLSDYLTERVTFHVDPEHEAVVIQVDGNDVLLAEGEWSDWVPVRYDALPWGLAAVDGVVRFYARQLRPDFQVYASPVNISPANPAMPVTSPEGWAKELYDLLGYYYTQGMPEDTNALKDRVFDDDDYAKQVALVQDDTDAMLDLALRRFERGDLTFIYFSDIDLQCHMLWRHGDPKYIGAPPHPAIDDPEMSHRHALDIDGYHMDVDRRVGEVRERLPEGTVLLVMSDHGFAPYTRKVHLNAWLRDHGYLTLKDGEKTGSIPAGDVDWSRTKAYGYGFNGIYLNLEGREAEGIVAPEDADALMEEIAAGLEALVDPKDGKRVVVEAYLTREIYSGTRVAEGPDMVVGYDEHYGTSDASTLGEIEEPIVEDNTSRWSGNHLMSPDVVPGVLLVNREIEGDGYDLTDLPVTLLAHYGIAPVQGMVGEPIPLR
ncbi:MAG: alkaline phosphatase family protein [Deltaproteobacteria bacterium]|nr:alkaline phosphatase family protein [Deltaproteobacteria bacterium]